MSGGGGSGDIGPSGPSADLDCARLTFETQLASPDAAVVGTLTVADVLAIELQVAESGRRVIAAVASDGRVAGAITSHTADLVRCIQEGFAYMAEVTAIDGGWVDVRVRPA